MHTPQRARRGLKQLAVNKHAFISSAHSTPARQRRPAPRQVAAEGGPGGAVCATQAAPPGPGEAPEAPSAQLRKVGGVLVVAAVDAEVGPVQGQVAAHATAVLAAHAFIQCTVGHHLQAAGAAAQDCVHAQPHPQPKRGRQQQEHGKLGRRGGRAAAHGVNQSRQVRILLGWKRLLAHGAARGADPSRQVGMFASYWGAAARASFCGKRKGTMERYLRDSVYASATSNMRPRRALSSNSTRATLRCSSVR